MNRKQKQQAKKKVRLLRILNMLVFKITLFQLKNYTCLLNGVQYLVYRRIINCVCGYGAYYLCFQYLRESIELVDVNKNYVQNTEDSMKIILNGIERALFAPKVITVLYKTSKGSDHNFKKLK